MKIWPYMCVALLGAALSAAFPKEKQLFGWLTAGAAGVLLLLGLLGEGGALGKGLEDFFSQWGIPADYGKAVLRMGVTALGADLGAQACRDAGSGGLAMKLELCGKIFIVLEALPWGTVLLEAGKTLLEAGA